MLDPIPRPSETSDFMASFQVAGIRRIGLGNRPKMGRPQHQGRFNVLQSQLATVSVLGIIDLHGSGGRFIPSLRTARSSPRGPPLNGNERAMANSTSDETARKK